MTDEQPPCKRSAGIIRQYPLYLHEKRYAMRRDMDLIRDMLRTVADSDDSVDAKVFVTDEHPSRMIAYHVQMIHEAKLVDEGKLSYNGKTLALYVGPLTWSGQDFLDAVRSDNVWSKTKKIIESTIGYASFDVIKAVANKIALDMLMQ